MNENKKKKRLFWLPGSRFMANKRLTLNLALCMRFWLVNVLWPNAVELSNSNWSSIVISLCTIPHDDRRL